MLLDAYKSTHGKKVVSPLVLSRDMTYVSPALTTSLAQAKLRVIGEHDIANAAQAQTVMALAQAFSDCPEASLYIEPCTFKSTHRPPDIVLVHPAVGVLVIEVKGYSSDFIERLEAGSFYLRSSGFPKPKNPVRQVQNCMFDLVNAAMRLMPDGAPFMHYAVAFPNIDEDAWIARGFHLALPSHELLLAEQVATPDLLRHHLIALTEGKLAKSALHRPISPEQLRGMRLVFGDSAVINETRTARAIEETSLGAILDDFSLSDKHLSEEQKALCEARLPGSPRLVRGVAGSGKSVVLANQVARYLKRAMSLPKDLFDDDPKPPRVAVVCFNRALVPLLEQRIADAYMQLTSKSVPEGVLLVRHINKLFFELSENGLWRYRSYRKGSAAERATYYREQLSDPNAPTEVLFDALFVDEGQDLEGEELALLHDLVKPNPETLERPFTVFYDDAQNLYARPRPNWRSLGIEVGGGRTTVMKACFRNTREIVGFAYNMLLGSAAADDLRVQTRTYADIGYLKQAELVHETDKGVEVRFASRSFAAPSVNVFATLNEEKAWLVGEIARLVGDEQVRLDDILVIFKEPDAFKDLPALLEAANIPGLEGFITPYFSGPRDDRDRFIFEPNHLTLSTPYGAKGYDAHVVFVVGTDLFRASGDDNMGRAAFYVAATRAKNVLYVSGTERPEPTLLSETSQLLASGTQASGVGC